MLLSLFIKNKNFIMLLSQFKNILHKIRTETIIKKGNLLSLRNIIAKSVNEKTDFKISLNEKDCFELSFHSIDRYVVNVLFAEKSNSRFNFELKHCGLFGFGFIYPNFGGFIPFGYQVITDSNVIKIKIYFSSFGYTMFSGDFMMTYSRLSENFKTNSIIDLKDSDFHRFYRPVNSICLLELIPLIIEEWQKKQTGYFIKLPDLDLKTITKRISYYSRFFK